MSGRRWRSSEGSSPRELQVRLGRVGYDAAGPYVTLEAPGELLYVRPAGPGVGLVGYHLGLLGLGGADPVARAAALAVHLDAALQSAASAPADRGVLLGAVTPLHHRLAELVAQPLCENPVIGPLSVAPSVASGRTQP